MMVYHVHHVMAQDNATATDEPLTDISAEREAIRNALPDGVFVLTYDGGEPGVALVEREKSPPSEYALRGERIVLVEWHGEDDYALSVADGRSTGWELSEELVSMHQTRDEALTAAAELFADG